MKPKREFKVGDPVVVTGRVDPSKPGGELLGKTLTVTSVGNIVKTNDGAEWHTWMNGGYNWELPPDAKAPGAGSAYQELLKIEHADVA